MIRIQRIDKPVELTDKLQKELTEKFKQSGKNVWNKQFIKDALLKMSHDKCCYCETNIKEESKYLEVEHFYPKSIYKDEVVDWENLLPSCKRCNGKKGELDTKNESIINPTKDIPKEHIYINSYRFYPKDDLGKNTISNVGLNNRERLVNKRFQIGNELVEKLEDIVDLIEEYKKESLNRRKNKIIERLENLMRQAIPEAEYAATCATVILNNEYYKSIKLDLKNLGFWSNEFIELEKQMEFCQLEISKL